MLLVFLTIQICYRFLRSRSTLNRAYQCFSIGISLNFDELARQAIGIANANLLAHYG